eukprot:3000286-Pleurochrysis_carterae.AAC.1
MDICDCKDRRLKRRVRYKCAGAHEHAWMFTSRCQMSKRLSAAPPRKKTQNSTFAAPSTIRVMGQAPQQPSPQSFEVKNGRALKYQTACNMGTLSSIGNTGARHA